MGKNVKSSNANRSPKVVVNDGSTDNMVIRFDFSTLCNAGEFSFNPSYFEDKDYCDILDFIVSIGGMTLFFICFEIFHHFLP